MNVLAFAASNSSKSINKTLVTYAGQLLTANTGAQVEVIDLNDYEVAIYSIDREENGGIPDKVQELHGKIGAADALIISFAEHNGNLTVAYKNLADWMSRIDRHFYQNKPCILLSTSPGGGGGRNALNLALGSAPHIGMDVKASLIVPRFGSIFDKESGQMTDEETKAKLSKALKTLIN